LVYRYFGIVYLLVAAIIYVLTGLVEKNTDIEVYWIKPLCFFLGPLSAVLLIIVLVNACFDGRNEIQGRRKS